jgi:hypothetical protein
MRNGCLFFLVFLLSLSLRGQQAEWSTELQSEFIDISGLFGLKEPAQVTMAQHRNKGFFVDGFHSFSWREAGKTIQTFFGVGYTFKFDSSGNKSLSLKNDFAFNRVANNGSFLRPMLIGKWKYHPRQTFYWVSWIFFDTRTQTSQPLNGGIMYVAHAYTLPLKSMVIRNELRLLFVRIMDVRDVIGFTNQLKFTHKQSNLYTIANIGYSFYRSDNQTELIGNVGLGKVF